MSSKKHGLGVDVLTAARERIAWTFETFPRVCVSFSGGKDSTVMLHLAAEEAAKRSRKFGLLFIDLEAQYKLTIEHVAQCYEQYADLIEPYWIALPMHLRNAVSQYEPQWVCWEESREQDWVRPRHPLSIATDEGMPFVRWGMEFEEFIEAFGHWYGKGELTATLVGIRADESLNRFRTLIARKSRFQNKQWTTWKGGGVYNVYPIYDWRTEDLWTYHAKTGLPHNALYDRMHQAGLTIHQMRICQPYGDDQRKGLWLYHVIEPETWGRVVARVNGANQGAEYCGQSGNVLGNLKITKPEGHSWQSFANLLISSMPPATQDHYRVKVRVFLNWYSSRGYPDGLIPDEGPMNDKNQPSWLRICKALLRNDYWCKGLSFTQHKSAAYERYMRVKKERNARWNM